MLPVDYEKMYYDLKDKYNDLMYEHEKSLDTIRELEEKVEELSGDCSDLEEDLSEKDCEISDLEDRILELEDELDGGGFKMVNINKFKYWLELDSPQLYTPELENFIGYYMRCHNER